MMKYFKRSITLILGIIITIGALVILRIALTYKNTIAPVSEPFQKNMHTVDLFDENFSEIRNRENIIEDLIRINNSFKNSSHFEFLEINLTTIYQYAAGNRMELNAAYLSQDIIDYFSLKTENDSFGTLDNFENDLKYMPIILGNHYKLQYQIGDEIELMVRGYPTTAYVIDFLDKDESILYFNVPVNLNDYIILPFTSIFAANETTEEIDANEYNFRLLLDKNNGLVVPHDSIHKVKQEIKNISKYHKLPYALSVSVIEEYRYANGAILICSIVLTICFVIFIRYTVLFIKYLRSKK